MRKSPFILFIVLSACSILSKKDGNQEVQEFLIGFQQSISKSDSVVLNQFRTSQSPEGILAAIRLLRNPDQGFIDCQPSFAQSQIFWESGGPRVIIPVSIQTSQSPTTQNNITLWLERKGDSFIISRLDAEDFYKKYFQAFSMIKYEKDRAEQLIKLQVHFDKTIELQKTYDSVIWFTQLGGKAYYYVVNGQWNHFKNSESFYGSIQNYDMGLVDEAGRVIVPPQFDLIGTPEIVFPGTIEVMLNNKIGYYSLTGSELVPAKYDLIIPYVTQETKALVKIDSVYGWLDPNFIYHAGFPFDEAMDYLNKFSFLEKPLRLDGKEQPLCQVPDPEEIGNGIIIPPSYLVRYGIFDPILPGFVTGYEGFFSENEFIQKESFNVFNLTDQVNILITHFKTRYLEGREEFYYTNKLTLVDQNLDTLSTSRLWGESIQLKRIDSTLLEATMTYDSWEPDESGAMDYPAYTYYQIKDNELVQLQSNRDHDMTQYIKLDSSYFQGQFRIYDFDTDDEMEVTFMPPVFFVGLRNDILASYGYIFTDQKVIDGLQYKNWYVPSIKTYEEVYSMATEIDKHNLDFIQRIIGPVVTEAL
ncbi:MAG: WG repeat-containing protein [Cyclobacteriaceae bacterium]